MDKIISKFTTQLEIDPNWLFRLRFENGEETGPYSFSHLADLLLGGAITGNEDVSWYPNGEWIPLGGWGLFQKLLKEFVKTPKISASLRDQFEKIIKRFPSPISLSEPFKEDDTALLEREEYDDSPSVEKFFVPSDIIPKKSKVVPRMILVIVLLITGYLIFSGVREKSLVAKATVKVVIPPLESKAENKDAAIQYIQHAKDLMREDTPIAYQQSVEELIKGLGFDPKNKEARLLLAESYAFLWPLTDKKEGTADDIIKLIKQAEGIEGIERVRGRLLLAKGKLDAAKEISEKYLSTEINTRLFKAEVLIEGGKPQKSIEMIQGIIEEDPENVRAHYIYGLALNKLKKQEEAAEEFNRALSINPRHGHSTLNLALVQLQIFSNITKAEELLKSVTQYPSFVFPEELSTAHFYMGRLYEDRGQIDFAIREYQDAVRSNPEDNSSREALVRLGGENALAKISAEGERLKGADYYISIGNKYLEEGRKVDALAQYKLAIQVDPKNPNPYYYLGNLYGEEQDYPQALSQYQQAINRNPQDVKSLIKLADILTKSYRYKNAEEVIQKARQIEPGNPEVYLTSGKYFEAKGEYEAARQEYSRAVELDPKVAEAELSLGRIYSRLGEYDKAISYLDKAIKIDPNLEETYNSLAEAIFKKGFQTKAVAFLQQRLKQKPLSATTNRGLGKLYELSGNPDLAVDFYKKAIQIDQKDPRAYEDLAQLYQNDGKYQDALYYYASTTKLDPNNTKALFNQAYVFYEMNDYVSAVKTLQKVVLLNELFPKAHFNLGRIYTLLNYKRQAIDEFKKEIKFNPDLKETYESYLALGDIYYGLEEYILAKEQYEAGIKLNPAQTSAYLKLGRTYRSLGQLESAEEVFQALLKIDPNISEAWKDLGDLAAGRENNELAVKAYEEYLLRSPASPDAGEIKEKIRKLTNIYAPIP